MPRNSDAGHLDRVSALVLLCAQLLKRTAQEEQVHPVFEASEGARLRAERIREVEARQKKQWERDPRVVMRAAMGRR